MVVVFAAPVFPPFYAVGADNEDDLGARFAQPVDSMADNRTVAEAAELLWQLSAETAAAPCGHYNENGLSHHLQK